MEFAYGFESETHRFKISDGWDRSGEEGEYFGKICIDGMTWGVVLFDGEEDPDLFKAAGIMIEKIVYSRV